MNTEMIQAARAAFKQNPETACKALLGCTPEELFCEAVKAARGCNQHAHKPGCPDAAGGNSDNTQKRGKGLNEPLSLKGKEQEVFIKIDKDGNYKKLTERQYFSTAGKEHVIEKNRAGEYFMQGLADKPAKTPKEALSMAGINLSEEALKNITEYMKGKHEIYNFRRMWYEKDETPQISIIVEE
jgi:hypothetical protein